MSVKRPTIRMSSTGYKAPLLTPRNLLILALASLGAQGGMPAVLPTVEAGSPPSFVAFVALVAVLDRVIAV